MRICDLCLNVHAPANEYKVSLSRPNPDSDKARHTRVGETQIELCTGCEAVALAAVEKALAALRAGAVARLAAPTSEKT